MSTRHEQAGHLIRNNPRKAGGFALLVGGFAIYQGMIKPIQDATEGAASVSISEKLSMAGVVGVVLGLALLVGGARVASITHPEPGKSRTTGIIILGALVVLGSIAFYLVKSHLQSLGYVFQR